MKPSPLIPEQNHLLRSSLPHIPLSQKEIENKQTASPDPLFNDRKLLSKQVNDNIERCPDSITNDLVGGEGE